MQVIYHYNIHTVTPQSHDNTMVANYLHVYIHTAPATTSPMIQDGTPSHSLDCTRIKVLHFRCTYIVIPEKIPQFLDKMHWHSLLEGIPVIHLYIYYYNNVHAAMTNNKKGHKCISMIQNS